MNEHDKQQWIASLKVGDTVCDCRYLHQRIKTIHLEYCPRFRLLNWIIHRFPFALLDWLDDTLRRKQSGIIAWFQEVCDASLILEDGHGCSAFHCCDKPDHEWSHDETW